MKNKKRITDLDYGGKTVLIRVDFNVPLKDGLVQDKTRLEAAIPTINYVLKQGGKVVLISHLGRPKGQAQPEFSLAPVAEELSKLLERKIHFLPSDQVVDDQIKKKIQALDYGQVILLENTRFRPEETENGEKFAKELAGFADIYINDAFGTSHRAHASNVGVSKYLPSAVGFLIEKEIDFIGKAIEHPEKPFVAILGGAKVSDKIGVIENLLTKVDSILIGGGMAYTFLKAQGKEVGKSLLEEDKLDLALELIEKSKKENVKLLLPVDVVIARELTESIPTEVVSVDKIPSDMAGYDIGPKTLDHFTREIIAAKTVIWNGPMGVFELEPFNKGTYGIARALAQTKATTIVGGGDSASAMEKSGFKDQVSHISTGGGASLELLEGKVLPGIDAIESR